jgi:hypothetical protein
MYHDCCLFLLLFARRSAESSGCVYESKIDGIVTLLEILRICCMAAFIFLGPDRGLRANDPFINRTAYTWEARTELGLEDTIDIFCHGTESRQGKAS